MNKKLNEIFIEVFDINPLPENFKKNENDLWDSIKHLTLVVEIESNFGITLSPEEISRIDSYSSALDCINGKRNGNAN
jgi:acyl carrier protein